jgi:hypothetical protein
MVLMSAASLAADTRWRATAVAPRAGLPDVEIELGYPNQYVPAVNAPAVLRARGSERPFDGYIGYHIAIRNQQTLDMPVIARASMPPRSQWTFSTTARLLFGMATWMDSYFRERELVIEWRDSGMQRIAQRSVGVPPWAYPSRPLRVTRGKETPSAVCFGRNAVILDASSLSDQPQWYGGFSMIVVPTSLWFELPRGIRDAMFRSAVHVVFVGIPQRVPPMQPIDRALLPVELRAEPGAVAVPWPYNDAAATIPAPVSWRAKSGADVAGAPVSPYLVTNATATFAADERALRDPLPSFGYRFPWHQGPVVHEKLPALPEVIRYFRPAILFLLFAILSISGWLLLRRRAHILVLIALVAVTLVALGWRNRVRPAVDHDVFERVMVAAPGVVRVTTTYQDAGPVPSRPVSAVVAQAAADRVLVAAARVGDDMEVRTSSTPPGFGDLYSQGRVWGAPWRVTTRRELVSPGAIRIRSRDAEKLVVEYDSVIPVDRIAAEWIWNDRKHYGETGVTSSRGVATIRSFRMAWQEVGTWLSARPWVERSPGWRTSVELMHATRGRTVLIQFPQQFPAAAQAFIAVAVLPRDEHGDLAMLLALPAPVTGPAEVMIDRGPSRLHQAGNVRAVMLSGPGGTARRTPSSTVPFGMTFPAEDMRRIAPAGGLIRVSVETSASVADISSAEFELRVRSRQ